MKETDDKTLLEWTNQRKTGFEKKKRSVSYLVGALTSPVNHLSVKAFFSTTHTQTQKHNYKFLYSGQAANSNHHTQKNTHTNMYTQTQAKHINPKADWKVEENQDTCNNCSHLCNWQSWPTRSAPLLMIQKTTNPKPNRCPHFSEDNLCLPELSQGSKQMEQHWKIATQNYIICNDTT